MTTHETGRRDTDTVHSGWLLLAFLQELENDITPATVGTRPLVVVREGDSVRVADAACPHRGAHLGFGGTLERHGIRCPFHGRLIQLAERDGDSRSVREYRTLVVGDLVFVLLDDRQDRGFTARMNALRDTYYFMPGFVLSANVAPELVVENAFDTDHFEAVHSVARPPALQVRPGDDDTLLAEGRMHVRRPNLWQGETTATRFAARAVSPLLVMTELGETEQAQTVITSATPTPTGCVIRVAAAAPMQVPANIVRALLEDSQIAFEQDLTVWEHLVPGAPEHLDDLDRGLREYRRFCGTFASAADGGVR